MLFRSTRNHRSLYACSKYNKSDVSRSRANVTRWHRMVIQDGWLVMVHVWLRTLKLLIALLSLSILHKRRKSFITLLTKFLTRRIGCHSPRYVHSDKERGTTRHKPVPWTSEKSKSAMKGSSGVVVGWGWLCLSCPIPSLPSKVLWSTPAQLPPEVQHHMQIQQSAAQNTISLGVCSAVRSMAKREWGKLIALSQRTKNVSCIKGAANGGFFRFSHLLLFASKAVTDRNDKRLQHHDSPKQLQLPVLIWASKYERSQPSITSIPYFALWRYLCLNWLSYMNSYVLLKLKQRHTEADYTSKFSIFRTILQHVNGLPQSSLCPSEG